MALVAASLTAPAAADPVGDPGKTPTSSSSERAKAERALDRVERVFAGKAPRVDATMALLDLWKRQASLSAADRQAARGYLARPTDPIDPEDPYSVSYEGVVETVDCGTNMCLHYVTSGPHAVPDDAYIEATKVALERVADTYLAAGYKPVKGDGAIGGNAKPDVYLADVGDKGLYGYCTSDQPVPGEQGPWDAWSFCVLDNDFNAEQFPSNTPIENMQVTAAHEYFHAVQFAYDSYEDPWIMEATATWAEERLYDDVDDNSYYLPHGPLGKPAMPLDTYETEGLHQYGTWIFFEFLTQQLDASQGGMPTLVRDIWRRMDGAADKAYDDEFSLQAVVNALADQEVSFTRAFALFADANRAPWMWYEEGAENGYVPAPDGQFAKKDGWYVTKLDHLSSASGSFAPRSGTKKLTVKVDMSDLKRGSMAVVTVYPKTGSASTSFIALDKSGNGSKTVPFTKTKVHHVDVTLVNASLRSTCWQNFTTPPFFSCYGTPTDDRQTAKVKANSIS